ncbi:ATP-binding protein, partial [Streptomyces sp. NPDC057074]
TAPAREAGPAAAAAAAPPLPAPGAGAAASGGFPGAAPVVPARGAGTAPAASGPGTSSAPAGPGSGSGAAPSTARPGSAPATPESGSAPVEPAPTHDLADREQDDGVAGLPKRRRGRTLAAAERARATARAAEPRPAPAADDAKVRAARFSSFRQAVRSADTGASRTGTNPMPDGADSPRGAAAPPAPDETTPDHPSHSHAHPEGDTTS